MLYINMKMWPLLTLLLVLGQNVVSAGEADNQKNCNHLATLPLQGDSHLTRTSLPSVYDLKHFVGSWDMPNGVYWWWSPLKKSNVVNPIYGGSSSNMKVEVGQGWWLTKPQVLNDSEDGSRWTSHSFVATRVPAFNHTSCCCQIMSADLSTKRLWLTEYCRAVVDGLDKSPAETCAPYAEPACPKDNATALQESWPMPSYSESYSACLDPLGTWMPKPKGLTREELPGRRSQHLKHSAGKTKQSHTQPREHFLHACLFLLASVATCTCIFLRGSPSVQPETAETGGKGGDYKALEDKLLAGA